MFINRGAELQKPQQCFTPHLFELATQKVTEDRRLESKKVDRPPPVCAQRQVFGAQVSKLSLFTKKTNIQMPKAAPALTSEGGKVSISQFSGDLLKLLHKGAT